MGCTVQKGSQRTRQSKSKSNSSPYLICSTEAKIQIFIQTLSQTSTRDRSKSARSCSPLLANNSSKQIKKSADLDERQNKQKIALDLKHSNQQEGNQMLMGMTPQFGKKNIKTISKHLKQVSWQSVDNIMESDQSIQFYNGVTKQRIFNYDDCLTLNRENRKQDT